MIFFLAAATSGCTIDPTFHGRVVSTEENIPISGAIVTAFWRSSSGMIVSHNECDRFEVITSSADGTFEIPGKFTPLSWKQDRSSARISAFKAGLKVTEVVMEPNNGVSIKMARITSGSAEKLDALLLGVRAGRHCERVAPRSVSHLEELAYIEAKPLAKQFLSETGRDEKLYSIEDIEKARIVPMTNIAIGGVVNAPPPIAAGIKVEGNMSFTPAPTPAPPTKGTAKSAPAPIAVSSAPN